jgi:FkbM family methyltransferase
MNNIYDREKYILTDSPIKKDLLKLFKKDQKLIIMDIGGCEGEESIRYSRIFPNSSIFCFEPLPKNQRMILQNIRKYNVKNVELIPIALSDEEGKQKLYVSSGQPKEKTSECDWDFGNKSSSLLPPDSYLQKYFPWLEFNEEIIVPTTKLYNLLVSKNISVVDFIHLDVQGAELKVLTGAGLFMKKIKAIWLEVADVMLYNKQPVRPDIEDFMKNQGFYLSKSVIEGQVGDQLYLNSKYFKTLSFFFVSKILQI